jgi:hypothetical protein
MDALVFEKLNSGDMSIPWNKRRCSVLSARKTP